MADLPVDPFAWQAQHSREDAHHASQARSGAFLLPVCLSGAFALLYALEKVVRLLVGRDPAQTSLSLILGTIALLVLTLAGIAGGVALVFHFSQQLAAAFYAVPEHIRISRILRYRLFGRPLLPPPLSFFIKFSPLGFRDGKAEKSELWPAWTAATLGGPFPLTITDGTALYLESGERFSRVVGPGTPQPFLALDEKVKAIVDLRPKAVVESLPAWTRDGILVTVAVKMTCRIGDPARIPGPDQLVFAYDPLAVKLAVEHGAVHGSRSSRPGELADWSELAWEETRDILSRAIGNRLLNELLLDEGDKGQLFSGKILEGLKQDITASTRSFGVYLTELSILELALPQEVRQQRIRNWEAERQGIETIQAGRSRAQEIRTREKARAEAQHDLILAIADGLERNKSGHFSEPLLLSLSSMLDTTLKNPLARASLARETLETLEQLQRMLDKPA